MRAESGCPVTLEQFDNQTATNRQTQPRVSHLMPYGALFALRPECQAQQVLNKITLFTTAEIQTHARVVMINNVV